MLIRKKRINHSSSSIRKANGPSRRVSAWRISRWPRHRQTRHLLEQTPQIHPVNPPPAPLFLPAPLLPHTPPLLTSFPRSKPRAVAPAPPQALTAPVAQAKNTAQAGSYGIQLGAFKSSAAAANKRWSTLGEGIPQAPGRPLADGVAEEDRLGNPVSLASRGA